MKKLKEDYKKQGKELAAANQKIVQLESQLKDAKSKCSKVTDDLKRARADLKEVTEKLKKEHADKMKKKQIEFEEKLRKAGSVTQEAARKA